MPTLNIQYVTYNYYESAMEFLVSDVTKFTGVKRLRLHQWIERKYLSPSVQKASGHGTRNVYDEYDLYKIELFKRLITSGISRELSASIIKNFNQNVKEASLSFRGAKHVQTVAPKHNLVLIVEVTMQGNKKDIKSWVHMTADQFHHTIKPIDATIAGKKADIEANLYFYNQIMKALNAGSDAIMMFDISGIIRDIDEKVSNFGE